MENVSIYEHYKTLRDETITQKKAHIKKVELSLLDMKALKCIYGSIEESLKNQKVINLEKEISRLNNEVVTLELEVDKYFEDREKSLLIDQLFADDRRNEANKLAEIKYNAAYNKKWFDDFMAGKVTLAGTFAEIMEKKLKI